MRALFAPAAAPRIGGGHVLRGLALARAFQVRGVQSVFAVPPWGARLVERFGGVAPPEVHPLPRSGEAHALAAALEAVGPTLLVLDDYGLDASGTAGLVRPGLVTVVIDDLADRTYRCELLVDPGYGRRPEDYAGRVPGTCEVLVGPRYALLRPEFGQAPSARDFRRPVERVFVSFGLSDVGGIAAWAVRLLRPLAPRARFDVALASDAASLPELLALAERDDTLRLHVDAQDVAGLMAAADVAVGAGGASTWERCALALPTLAVIVAENQRAMISRLAAADVLLAVDAEEADASHALASGFARLLQPEVRASLAEASRALCDGQGAGRVADAALRRLSEVSGAGTPNS
jgi:UDP-2,4-diacetamido-2,4,6-trideoxy-beta-L-altropyranose hydrolase